VFHIEKVSACIITKDGEDSIRQCLESVRWADEIIVVDSGSTDATESICREFADRFIFHEWEGYAGQRTFALTQCSHPWAFMIDDDETVSPELQASIREELSAPGFDAYKVLRRNYFRGNPVDYAAMRPKPQIRLFRKECLSWIDRRVHEKPVLSGRCGWLKGYLNHYAVSDLSEWIEKNTRYAKLAAEYDASCGRRIGFWHFAGLPLHFLRRYLLRGGFLHGIPGLLFSALPAYFRFIEYSEAWDMQQADLREDGAQTE